MVEWCRQGEIPDSSTRAFSGNPTSKSHLVANQEDLDEGNDGNEISLSYFVQFFNTP